MSAKILVGRIVRLQIQRNSLKREEGARRFYDPAPLLAVDELTLTPAGACARTADGSFALDVHNTAHPHSRNRRDNFISILFTSHYAAMRSRFGDHLALGCAGENILVETSEMVPLSQAAGGFVIETGSGRVLLHDVVVAAPCKPYSEYALASPHATTPDLKAALQFLDGGMRGFYCRLEGDGPAVVAREDRVYLL